MPFGNHVEQCNGFKKTYYEYDDGWNNVYIYTFACGVLTLNTALLILLLRPMNSEKGKRFIYDSLYGRAYIECMDTIIVFP